MFRLFASSLVIGLMFGCAGTTRADDTANAIIDKAITAHGGPNVYDKIQGGHSKGKGKIDLMGGIEFNHELQYALPNKFKETVEMDIMGTKVTIETVFNGEKVAIRANGNNVPVSDKLKAAIKDVSQAMDVARLVNLKKKEFTLVATGETQVEGKPALGVKVSKAGQQDVDLYFDKASHLLVKIGRRGIDQMENEIQEDRIFVEYKKNDMGIPQPRKILVKHDGKNYVEIEMSEWKSLEKVDENVFEVP